ncbi:AsmA family protein [Desulfogranum mediterraneum]|uniref:AsmA family protein n=1 Tax=Desulfogranum mediterraneum TaxID=160661 RepID=UPI00048C2C21|nr:AsmA family protein [Desulfogranum mediterraneum]
MAMIKKIFTWMLISTLALGALALTPLIIMAVLEIPLRLDSIRPGVETALSTTLERKVTIAGSITIQPGLRPTLEVRGVQIDNPPGWTDTVFAAIELARVQVGLPALLKKELDLGEVTAVGGRLNLETNTAGINNWQLGSRAGSAPGHQARPTPPADGVGLQAVDTLRLEQLKIRYRDCSLERILSFTLEQLQGTAQQGQPLKITAAGSVQGKPYSFTLEGNELAEFHPRQQLYPLSISGQIVASPFTARGSFGRKGESPQLDLNATLDKIDIGALLEWLQLAEGIEATTDHLALRLSLRGDNLHDMVTRSKLSLSLQDGAYTLQGAGKGEGVPIAISQGVVEVPAGKAVSLHLRGMVETTPITIDIQGMALVHYLSKPQQLPLQITVKAADTRLDFHGKAAVPLSNTNITLSMELQGEKLNQLDQLLKLSLPPLGPYRLKGIFGMDKTGYTLSKLEIKIGASDLNGRMHINLEGEKPAVEIQLSSSLLQLDDFELGQWTPEKTSAAAVEEKAATQAENREGTKRRQEMVSLFSPETLARANAELQVRLDKVQSSGDTLGSGRLKIKLQDGRFQITPLELQLAEGTARTEFSYVPGRTAGEIQLGARIEGLDLGILARRAKPQTKMGGRLHLDMFLEATAPSLNQLMANARGHLDFAFVPENFDAGIIDLWAVNLLSALASKVDEGPSSLINCLVASFQLEQGIMEDRILFMDTTHMSVEGSAHIDFKKQRLTLRATPQTKKPEFFSLATPIRVSGRFDDFGIGINTILLTHSLASFITSPIHVPLRRIFAGEVPEDGAEACRMAWENRHQEQ